MLTLSDRLAGPFNAENVILPLDVSISEAIMNFQESGFKVTSTTIQLHHNYVFLFLMVYHKILPYDFFLFFRLLKWSLKNAELLDW